MKKNCVFVIENNAYFLDKMIKNFWYRDEAPFDLYLVYETKCGTQKADLQKVCDGWNNPNFVGDRILSIDDLIAATLPYLQAQGLNQLGEEFLDMWKMRSKLIAPIYFKQILGYEGAMLLDDDTLVLGPIEEHFDGSWREYAYGFNEMEKCLNKPAQEAFELVKDKLIKQKKSLGLGNWMKAWWQHEIFSDVWQQLETEDYRAILMNSGMNTYITQGFDAFVEYAIKLFNDPQVNELYKLSLQYYTSTTACNRGVPNLLWMIDEYFHQQHLHRMILDGIPVTLDAKYNECIFPKVTKDDQPKIAGIKTLLGNHIIHYICGKKKRDYLDLIDGELDKLGYNGNQSSAEVLEIINKSRNKVAKPISPDSNVIRYIDKLKSKALGSNLVLLR